MPASARGVLMILISSSRIRSAEMVFSRPALARIAVSVIGSSVKFNSVARRTARIRRKASSWKRSSALPTARMILAFISARPL